MAAPSTMPAPTGGLLGTSGKEFQLQPPPAEKKRR